MPAYNLMNTPGTSMDDLSPKTTQILHEVEQQYRLNQMLNGADGLRQMSGSTPNLAGLGLAVPKVTRLYSGMINTLSLNKMADIWQVILSNSFKIR